MYGYLHSYWVCIYKSVFLYIFRLVFRLLRSFDLLTVFENICCSMLSLSLIFISPDILLYFLYILLYTCTAHIFVQTCTLMIFLENMTHSTFLVDLGALVRYFVVMSRNVMRYSGHQPKRGCALCRCYCFRETFLCITFLKIFVWWALHIQVFEVCFTSCFGVVWVWDEQKGNAS